MIDHQTKERVSMCACGDYGTAEDLARSLSFALVLSRLTSVGSVCPLVADVRPCEPEEVGNETPMVGWRWRERSGQSFGPQQKSRPGRLVTQGNQT